MKNVMLDSLERMYKYGNFYEEAPFGKRRFLIKNGKFVGEWVGNGIGHVMDIISDLPKHLSKYLVNSVDHSTGIEYKLESEELNISEEDKLYGANILYSIYSSMLNFNNDKPYFISDESIKKKSVMTDILIRNSQVNEYMSHINMNLDYTTMIASITDKMIRFIEIYKDLCQSKKDFDPSLGVINEWQPFEFDVISSGNLSTDVKLNTRPLDNAKCSYEVLNERNYVTNPAVGRDEEIREMGAVLITKAYSPILLGAPGVGKTSIVEGLAYAINKGNVSKKLLDKKIIKITPTAIVSGCRYVGMVEEKVEAIIKFFRENPNAILYMDEIHTVIGAGVGGKENNDVANMLKPYIENGSIKMIGATTTMEYENIMQNDPAFIRRFKKIDVKEPDDSLLRLIVDRSIEKFEREYEIKFAINYDMQCKMVNLLIKLTGSKHRTYDDIRYNPALIISILEPAFGYAAYDDSDVVGIKYLSEAIIKCTYLYDKVKLNYLDDLSLLDNEDKAFVKKAILLKLD